MGSTRIQYLAHATFKVTTPEGRIVIIDPWFTGNDFINPEDRTQDRVDLFMVTHGHDDHFDSKLPDMIRATGARVAANNICRFDLLKNGVAADLIEPINLGGTISLLDVKVSMVQAFHLSHISTETEEMTLPHQAVGFVLQLSDGVNIYFAGDTGIFGDMKLIGDIYKPTVAVLPIGDRYTMGALEASYAVRLIGAPHVIPCHYGTFSSLAAGPEAFIERTKDIPNLRIHALRKGETLDCNEIK
ncbi:MAG TPA: metal-dependent hydrolase [Saprospiraceae bacterium]|nr:metal-dependent hydrolase [Saprospiraceae bacterium]HPI05967.1 metal-dependent hydrolase [Saprospiraceae bacterium]